MTRPGIELRYQPKYTYFVINWRVRDNKITPIQGVSEFLKQNNRAQIKDHKDELISDVLLWTPTYGCAKAGRPAQTYIQQLCEDTGCNPEDLPEAMNDREKWRERVRDIRASGAT